MDSDISNLNTYIELIKYTLNKIKNNQTDNITKIVIKSVNKNIEDIKKIYSNNNKEEENENDMNRDSENDMNRDSENDMNRDSENDSTKNNDTESISSNDIDFIDPEPSIEKEDSDEETSMIYYKTYPKQINKLEKFANSIYLY
jgi:hypothetical protein